MRARALPARTDELSLRTRAATRRYSGDVRSQACRLGADASIHGLCLAAQRPNFASQPRWRASASGGLAEQSRALGQERAWLRTHGVRRHAGVARGRGVQASRRTLLASSADGFSPVLYLRGPDSRLFDLEGRRVRPPPPATATSTGELPANLRALLDGPYALVLGEPWDDETATEVRARLREGLLQALQTREASVAMEVGPTGGEVADPLGSPCRGARGHDEAPAA